MRRMFLSAACLIFAAALAAFAQPAAAQGPTVYEGARLIVGDGSAPIEDAAFLVEGNRFTQVGRKGQVTVPAGATRVDLTGKTVIPAHRRRARPSGLPRCRHRQDVEGEFHARELHRPPAALRLSRRRRGHQHRHRHGRPRVQAARRDDPQRGAHPHRRPRPRLSGLRARRRLAQRRAVCGHQRRRRRARPCSELAPHKPDFVKIWVDDRNGTRTKLTPEMFSAAADEATKLGLRSIAHVFDLADAKLLVKAGVEGFMHSIRDQEVDDEFIKLAKEHNIWITPNLGGINRAIAHSRERHAGLVRRAAGARSRSRRR